LRGRWPEEGQEAQEAQEAREAQEAQEARRWRRKSKIRGDHVHSQTPFRPGLKYLAEGGQETEPMYGHGFVLPQFAMFPLLDDASAVGRPACH